MFWFFAYVVEFLPLPCIAVAIRLGFDVNMSDSGQTVLITAAARGRARVVRYLLQEGARVDHKFAQSGNCTALHMACCYGKLNVVRALVEYGNADIRLKTSNGKTPRAWAAYYGYKDICRYLDGVKAKRRAEAKQASKKVQRSVKSQRRRIRG